MSNDFRPAEPERTFRPMTEADLVDLPKGVWVRRNIGGEVMQTTGDKTTDKFWRCGESKCIRYVENWSIDSTYQPKAAEVKVGQRRRYSSGLPPHATRHLVGEVFTIQIHGVIAPTDFRILWEGGDVTVWTEKQILNHSTLLPSTDAPEMQATNTTAEPDRPERPYKPVPALKPHYGPMNLSKFEKLPPEFDKLLAKQDGRHFPVPRIDEPLAGKRGA